MTLRLPLQPAFRAALLAGATLLTASPAAAQQDDRRVQRLEQQVKELRAIVFQGRDTGQPVVVKPAGPDPEVTALSQKFDEQTEQMRHLTGQIETMQHDLDEARRTADQLRADDATRRQAVDDRLARLEGGASAVAPPAADPAVAPPPAGSPPSARAARSAALTAGAYAGDTSRLGGAPAGSDGFQGAYKRLTDADYPGAQAGFEAWLAANAASPRAGEARYYIGQSLYMRESYADAARSYAQALKGWPRAKWAPEATVKLAQSLSQVDDRPHACAALAEFDRRYAREAPAATRTRARATRTAAKCVAA